jgi:hypothetical protein
MEDSLGNEVAGLSRKPHADGVPDGVRVFRELRVTGGWRKNTIAACRPLLRNRPC